MYCKFPQQKDQMLQPKENWLPHPHIQITPYSTPWNSTRLRYVKIKMVVFMYLSQLFATMATKAMETGKKMAESFYFCYGSKNSYAMIRD